MLEGPVIQGSSKIRNGSGLTMPVMSMLEGSKERRNEASSFRCLMVSVILPAPLGGKRKVSIRAGEDDGS